MATRTFVLEGEPRRFWDVSWEGPLVEITSGKWGTQGRAREASFATLGEREAFVAAEIAKITRKGYREVNEVAPAPEVAPDARKVAALRARIEARQVPAWLPTFAPGSEGIGVVRGPMTFDRDEPWPTCGVCGEPLAALLELDLARVPAEHLRADALVQLFWCEAWEELGRADVCSVSPRAWLARRRRRSGEKRASRATRGTPCAIVGFTRHEEAPLAVGALRADFEAASQETLDALLASVGAPADLNVTDPDDLHEAVVRALGLYPRNEHKLGGVPTFVQEYERPFRSQIFQLEAKAPFDVNFGDVGAGHVLLGADGTVHFTWASH